MSETFVTCRRAAEIPADWDRFCEQTQGSIFHRREVLALLEETNPGERRYFLALSDAMPCGIAVAYRIGLNPLMYLGRWARLRLWIVGIPCSVSVAGYRTDSTCEKALLNELRNVLGFFLLLNLSRPIPGMRAATTLPEVRLSIDSRSFCEYWDSLRSSYRRWLRTAMVRTNELRVEVCSPTVGLSEEIYGLYRSVYERSPYKLECQSAEFFARFPGKLILLHRGDDCCAFALLACEGITLSFVFCGFERERGAVWVYVRLLAEIVRFGIDQGFRAIRFGQTAEDTKLRFGGRCEPRYMQVGCKWPWLEAVCGVALRGLSYHSKTGRRSVFRKAHT